MPHSRPGEKAVVLSLAIEDALRRDDWDDLSTLLNAREKEIERLVAQKIVIDKKDEEFLKDWQTRVLDRVVQERRSVLQEMTVAGKENRARRAYAQADPSRAYGSTV